MYREKIVNVATGLETYRDLRPEEIAVIEAAKAKREAEVAAIAAAEVEADAKRQALLDKLGITADEAKLLLG